MLKMIAAFGFICAFVTVTVAEKSSGTLKCEAPNPFYVIHVPDSPHHAMSVDQMKCRWIQPVRISGVTAIGGVASGSDEVHERQIETHGYYVDTLANGDKLYWRVQGGGTLREDLNVERNELSLTLVGGTGKFKSAKGHGRCIDMATADGSSVLKCDLAIEGAK
jgi:hypothetical protein